MTDFEKGIKKNKTRSLDPSESELWEKVTRTIFQTKQNAYIHKKQKIKTSSYIKKQTRYSLSLGTISNSIKRTQREKINLQDKLDLHGMTQEQAYSAIIHFVETAFYNAQREVLIITGKGSQLNRSQGVLKEVVPKWLNEIPLKNWVKGFNHASLHHGGEGALYVIIRRKK